MPKAKLGNLEKCAIDGQPPMQANVRRRSFFIG